MKAFIPAISLSVFISVMSHVPANAENATH